MSRKLIKLNECFLNTPIAHRGCHNNDVAENSMEAFKIAKERNLAIELDIYRLKDGEFAVFHDPNLKRMTGQDMLISSLSKSKLKNYKLWDNQNIPLLKDVLSMVDGQVPILIELKPENGFTKKDLPDLLKLLAEYNHNDKIAIQSFNPLILKSIKKLTNIYPVGILSSYKLNNMGDFKKYILKSLFLFNFVKADFISYDIRFIPNKYVKKFKKKHVPVLAWVVNSNEKLELAKKYADNIIFENLEILENYGK